MIKFINGLYEKYVLDKVKTNKLYRNVFAGIISVLLALIYNAIFLQTYERTQENGLITTFFLVLLIAICIYLIYLLITYIHKVSLEKSIDAKRVNRIVAMNAMIIYVIIAGALILCSDNMQRSSFWESDLIETTYFAMNDLSGESPNYEITGIDPFVIYEIQEDMYNKGIVFFDEKTSDDIVLAVFYASSTDEFSEERKVLSMQKEGSDYAVFRLPDDYRICHIRIDYEGNNGIQVGEGFHIKSVFATKNTLLTKLHGKLTTRTCLNLLLLSAIFVMMFLGFNKGKTLWKKYYSNTSIRENVEIMVIFVLPAILFWKYISGQAGFVFLDVAYDSFAQYYPKLIHFADRVRNGQWTEMFSFIIGLGDKEGYIVPNLYNWTAMFGRENVAHLMGISVFFKVALSGLFTYEWVSLWEIRDEKRLIITLGYEFNTMLTIRSCWASYPNVALVIIFWVYCFELAYRKRKNKFYLLFALASELTFLQFDLYYSVLYGFIFLVYIFCRVLSDGDRIKSAFKYGFLYYGMFAFWGSADSMITSFKDALSSGRISNNYSNAVNDILNSFKFQWDMLYEAFVRSIGQSIIGVSDDFLGWENVLEGPAFYFGIFMLLIIPVAYFNLPKKKKTLFALGGLAAVLFIAIRVICLLVAGFSRFSFKHTSFWVTLLGILMILEAFNNIKENGFRKNSLFVFNITAAIYFALIISILFSGKLARINQWWLSLIYFLIYVELVNLFYAYNVKELRWVFILVIMTEGTVLSYDALNNRPTYTIDEMKELIYDDSYDAIQEIAIKDNSWYRIDKKPGTTPYCDSYVQNYYGTVSYVAGSLIGAGVRNYYTELSLPTTIEMRVLCGTAGNLYANSLLGVKYHFLKGMDNCIYGTKYIASYGDVDVYENTLALPIGYFYDEVIDIEEFSKLSYWDRNKILLEKVLCTTENSKFDKDVVQEEPSFDGECIKYQFTSTQKSIDVSEIKGLIALDLHFKLNMDSIENDEYYNGNDNVENKSEEEISLYGRYAWTDSDGNYNDREFMTTGVIELCADDISSIWFDATIAERIDYVNVYVYNPDEYYARTVAAIHKLQENGMKVTSISDYEICGTVTAPSNGVFATSIPYNTNWEIYVDGVKNELLEVNTGFIGTKISAGNHDIRIYYRHRSWVRCNTLKCVGMGILLIWGIYITVYDVKNKLKRR